jgi:hypothetical protein
MISLALMPRPPQPGGLCLREMRQVVGISAAVVWFAANGLLWWLRLPDLYWLLGSFALAAVGFLLFFRYVMRA